MATREPPFLGRRRVSVRVSLIAIGRLEELSQRTGLSRDRVVDLLVRGADVSAAVEVIEDRLATDTRAIAAWREAGA